MLLEYEYEDEYNTIIFEVKKNLKYEIDVLIDLLIYDIPSINLIYLK